MRGFVNRITNPETLSVSLVTLFGINVISSGHISQGWIVGIWPQASWFLVILIGAAFAMIQAYAVAEASGKSAAPEAEAALAYRGTLPSIAFALRLLTFISIMALLGSLMPMIWETVIEPTVLVNATVGSQFIDREFAVNFLTLEGLYWEHVLFDMLILLFCLFIIIVLRRLNLDRKHGSFLLLALTITLVAAWFLPAAYLVNSKADLDPRSNLNSRDHYESYYILESVEIDIKQAEQQISQLLDQYAPVRNFISSDPAVIEEERKLADDRFNKVRNSVLNYQPPGVFDQDRIASAMKSMFWPPGNPKFATVLAHTFSAACVGGWIFFSFFSLGESQSRATSTSARKKFIWNGSLQAILFAVIIFSFGWFASHSVMDYERYSSFWGLYLQDDMAIPLSNLHLYGLSNTDHPARYLVFSAIWAGGLVALLITYIRSGQRSVEGLVSDTMGSDRHRVLLWVLGVTAMIFSYYQTRIDGLFSAQIGIFVATVVVQAVLVWCSFQSKPFEEGLHTRSIPRKRVSIVFAAAVVLLLASFLFGQVYLNSSSNSEGAHSSRGSIALTWLLILVIVGGTASVYYKLRREHINERFGSDLLVSYDDDRRLAPPPHTDELKILVINGLYGSRRAIISALNLASQERVNAVVFLGPLLADRFVVHAKLGSSTWRRREFNLVIADNRLVVEHVKSSLISVRESEIERRQGTNIGVYTMVGGLTAYSRGFANTADISNRAANIVEEELNWLFAQTRMLSIKQHSVNIRFGRLSTLDKHALENELRSDGATWISENKLSSKPEIGERVFLDDALGEKERLTGDVSVSLMRNEQNDYVICFGTQNTVKDEDVLFTSTIPKSYSESGAMVGTLITIDKNKQMHKTQLIIR